MLKMKPWTLPMFGNICQYGFIMVHLKQLNPSDKNGIGPPSVVSLARGTMKMIGEMISNGRFESPTCGKAIPTVQKRNVDGDWMRMPILKIDFCIHRLQPLALGLPLLRVI
eukprot:s1695_g14.t1